MRLRLLAPALFVLAVSPIAHGENRTRVSSDRSSTVVRESDERAPARGPAFAPVTVEVFCTYILQQCGQIDTLLAALSERHPERLRVVYRQLPLPYREGQMLAEAAFEAHDQGKFFELSNELYASWMTTQPASRRSLERFAEKAGLDVERLRAAIADGRHRARAEADTKRKELFEIRSPPALVWNGRVITVPLDLEELEEVYDRAYDEAKDLVAEGTSLRRLYPLLLRRATAERAASQRRGTSHGAGQPSADVDLGAPRSIVPEEGAPSRGPDEAQVTIVMFGDFECPFCKQMHDTLRRVEELYEGRVRIVFKHFPIASHPNARRAAELAACAELQGKFWQVHDLLFRNARDLKKSSLARYASEAGLDAKQLAADLDAGACGRAVDRDLEDANELGVDSTPTIYINGLKLVSRRSIADLKLVIEDELRPGLLEEITAEP